jgi:hypothetical protein
MLVLLLCVAMMLPSVAPMAITWARAIGCQLAGATRAGRMVQQFVARYRVAHQKVHDLCDEHRGDGALAAVIFLERLWRRRPWLA